MPDRLPGRLQLRRRRLQARLRRAGRRPLHLARRLRRPTRLLDREEQLRHELGEQGSFRIGYGQLAIETWRVHGADGVNLRMWVDALIKGLYANESSDNAWAYLDQLGWARLAYGAPGANLAMLNELTSSRLRNQPVHAYHDNGQLTSTHSF